MLPRPSSTVVRKRADSLMRGELVNGHAAAGERRSEYFRPSCSRYESIDDFLDLKRADALALRKRSRRLSLFLG